MNTSFLQQPFRIQGEFVSSEPYGSGHINDTILATYNQAGREVRYIQQRINRRIFQDIPALMNNIQRVIQHSQDKLAESNASDRSRRSLVLMECVDGLPFHVDKDGEFWRTYHFIENATTYDKVETTLQATEAAKAFGKFQCLLSDLPGERLHETIPCFHDTPARYRRFHEVLGKDGMDRAACVKDEIQWFLDRENWAGTIIDGMANGEIPERITHNDTKLNNVMLDDTSMEGVCVIDLDTVMPGSVLFDFGDMVRTATNSGNEDTTSLNSIQMEMPMFEALVKGYLSAAKPFLVDRELELLAFSGKLITLETGLRFLTDYLDGDNYFKVHRDGHNLDRCRTQMALVSSIESKQSDMEKFVKQELSACAF